jgi:biotin-dependent carboxylase-like uncharacterized protein
MSGLKVIASGLSPTLQDFGRPWAQHLGVPPSGALDPSALRIANALVGNPADIAAIEIRLMGPTLEITAESARFALVGTSTPIEVLGEKPVQAPAHQSVRLTNGRRIRIGGIGDSGVAYLAVEGGFDLPPVYDSLSTYTRALIGGFEGRALADGDVLPLRQDSVEERRELKVSDTSWLTDDSPIRVILGPQDDYFTQDSIGAFFSEDFAVSREADRMGMRLDGPALTHARGHDIISDGIATGAIQVPGNGRPIVLLADHQTTGGYPKLGTVISADIPRLGRLRPGDALRFLQVDQPAAETALRELHAQVTRVIDRFGSTDPWLDLEALYRENLVSGVVGGGE